MKKISLSETVIRITFFPDKELPRFKLCEGAAEAFCEAATKVLSL